MTCDRFAAPAGAKAEGPTPGVRPVRMMGVARSTIWAAMCESGRYETMRSSLGSVALAERRPEQKSESHVEIDWYTRLSCEIMTALGLPVCRIVGVRAETNN